VTAPTVVAAGAIVWRVRDGHLQVLLVHRPKYKDWSWPKGKVEPGESVIGAAVREVAEETGYDVVLGIPLPTVQYPVSSGPKQVHYWAAQVAGRGDRAVSARPPVPRADEAEIDRVEWYDAQTASDKLTRPSDRRPLKTLLTAHARGVLDTRVLVITRHARARKRSVWKGDETDRPLTRQGVQQSLGLMTVLSAHGVCQVVTSPWTRCVSTVAPYAQAVGAVLEHRDELTEAAHSRSGEPVAKIVADLLHTTEDTVVCTHRPVLPTVVDVVAQAPGRGVRRSLPRRDPYLRPGHSLVVHLHAGTVVAVQALPPG
jgi:8-oxo-(d)GTP phosphatase